MGCTAPAVRNVCASTSEVIGIAGMVEGILDCMAHQGMIASEGDICWDHLLSLPPEVASLVLYLSHRVTLLLVVSFVEGIGIPGLYTICEESHIWRASFRG